MNQGKLFRSDCSLWEHSDEVGRVSTKEGASRVEASRRREVALVYSACHQRGGVERVVYETAHYLLQKGCVPQVYASQFPSLWRKQRRIGLHRVSGGGIPFGLGLPVFQMQTQCALAKVSHDAVAGFGVQAPPGCLLWVQSVHAAWWEQSRVHRRGFSRWQQSVNPFHRVVLAMERRMMEGRAYRRLIALTPEVRTDLSRFYGVPERDVELLPNGFHAHEFHVGLRGRYRSAVRRQLGISEQAWVLLFVANEWERKGLPCLLEAFAQISDPHSHLVVAGRLSRTVLQPLISRHGLERRVHLVGSAQPVQIWFGAADAFALPSSYEAWGMVVIEALASGIPALTSRAAGASEAVRPGVSGVIVEDPRNVDEVRQGVESLRTGAWATPHAIAESVRGYRWESILSEYERILWKTFP